MTTRLAREILALLEVGVPLRAALDKYNLVGSEREQMLFLLIELARKS